MIFNSIGSLTKRNNSTPNIQTQTPEDNTLTDFFALGRTKNPTNINLLKIAAWNSAGLSGKVDELVETMVKEHICLTFVSETWLRNNARPHPCIIVSLSSTSTKQQKTRQHHGIAVVVHPFFLAEYNQAPDFHINSTVEDSTNCCITAINFTFKGLTAIGVYLSPSLSIITCRTILNNALASQNSPFPQAILGDFNMRMGRITNDTVYNRRAKDINTFLNEKNFHLLEYQNTETPSFSTTKGKSTIDLIFITSKISNAQGSIFDVDDLGSDHKPIVLSLPWNQGTPRYIRDNTPRKIRIQNLKSEENLTGYRDEISKLMTEYTSQLKSTFLQITSTQRTQTECQEVVETLYSTFTKHIDSAARKTLGTYKMKIRKPNNWYLTKETKDLINQRRKSYNKWKAYQHTDATKLLLRADFLHLRKVCQRACELAKKQAFLNWCSKMDSMPCPEMLKTFKSITTKKKNHSAMSLANNESAMKEYEHYFSATFTLNEKGISPPRSNFNNNVGNPLLRQTRISDFSQKAYSNTQNNEDELLLALAKEELISDESNAYSYFNQFMLTKIIKRLPRCKAPGHSGLQNELLSAAADLIGEPLSTLFATIYYLETVPREWCHAIIQPIYKKGDASNIKNYRPISLTETIRKLYEKVILAMITPILEPLNITQNGFRKKRSTTDHIALLQECFIQSSSDHEFVAVFLDIKSAYDKVDRALLWPKIEQAQVPQKMIKTLKQIFDYNTAAVRVRGKVSKTFPIEAGLLQGSILSPILYSAFINDLAEKISRLEPTIKSKNSLILPNLLLYADDICLLSSNLNTTSELLRICESHALLNNYRFNPLKSEYIYRPGRLFNSVRQDLLLDNALVKKTACFSYLGIPFKSNGIAIKDTLDLYKEKAVQATHLLSSIGVKQGGLSFLSIKRIYISHIRSKIEYSLQVLPLNIGETALLENIQNICLKKLFGVGISTCATSCRLLLGVPTMGSRKTLLSVKWICHVQALSEKYALHSIFKNAKTEIIHKNKRSKRSALNIYAHMLDIAYQSQEDTFKIDKTSLHESYEAQTIMNSQNHKENDANMISAIATLSIPKTLSPQTTGETYTIAGLIQNNESTAVRTLIYVHNLLNVWTKTFEPIWRTLATRLLMDEVDAAYRTPKTHSLKNLKDINVDGLDLASVIKPNVEKKTSRIIMLWLLEKLPGKPAPCLQCKTLATKNHLIICSQIMKYQKLTNLPCPFIKLLNIDEENQSHVYNRVAFLISTMLQYGYGEKFNNLQVKKDNSSRR
jgi:hypothetical protein